MPLPADTHAAAEIASEPPTQSEADRPGLAAFVQRHRTELISRCAARAALRQPARLRSAEAAPGLPHFLEQLVRALDSEPAPQSGCTPGIGQSAAAHGATLWKQGCTVDAVIHEYGDVIQAVAELAQARSARISTTEFATLHRCLDEAIADAVLAHQNAAQQMQLAQQASQHRRLHVLLKDHVRLSGIAQHSFLAIQSGQVGGSGATGALLAHALDELLQLGGERLPQVIEAWRQDAEPDRSAGAEMTPAAP